MGVKVAQHLGFTFRVGGADSNQYARVDVTIDGVDTSLPIDPQLEEAKVALNSMWPVVVKAVDAEMDKIQTMIGSGKSNG